MEMRSFGQTGMRVSAVGFGAAEIGPVDSDIRTVDTLIGVAQDCGINVVDTAAMYLASEEKLGRALQGRRDRFLIFTKCGRFLPPKHSPAGIWLRAQRKVRKAVGHPEPYESGLASRSPRMEHSSELTPLADRPNRSGSTPQLF